MQYYFDDYKPDPVTTMQDPRINECRRRADYWFIDTGQDILSPKERAEWEEVKLKDPKQGRPIKPDKPTGLVELVCWTLAFTIALGIGVLWMLGIWEDER